MVSGDGSYYSTDAIQVSYPFPLKDVIDDNGLDDGNDDDDDNSVDDEDDDGDDNGDDDDDDEDSKGGVGES